MVAAVVANVSGLLTGGIHLFLRSNTISTIGPKSKYEAERQKMKRGIRVWAPGSGGSGPSRSGTTNTVTIRPVQRVDSTETLIGRLEKEEASIESPTGTPTYGAKAEPNPLRSNSVYPMATGVSVAAFPVQLPQPPNAKLHARKGSYSLFPNNDAMSTKSFGLLPATTYAPAGDKAEEAGFELLQPPPTILANGSNGRHRRDSSMASQGTVQIGLRFSNMDDMPPLNPKFFNDQSSVYSLDCPNRREEGASKRPSPLAQPTPDPDLVKPSTPEPAKPKMAPVTAALRAATPPQPEADEMLLLSPTVYSPQGSTSTATKVASGFTLPQSPPKASSGSSSTSPRSPPSAPRPLASRDRAEVKKGDWI